jgi:hypothetical protein
VLHNDKHFQTLSLVISQGPKLLKPPTGGWDPVQPIDVNTPIFVGGAPKDEHDQPSPMLDMIASYYYIIYFFPLSSNVFGFWFLNGLLSGRRTMGVLA